MIFKPELLAKVFDGTKTVTRRPVKAGKPCPVKVGQTYAVTHRMGGVTSGRIRVVSVSRCFVGDVTEDEARLEGFATRAEFVLCWEAIYGHIGSSLAWRIEFELVEQTHEICACDGLGVVPLEGEQ